MKKIILLSSIVLFQTALLHGMDQASLAVVTPKEVNALARCQATHVLLQSAGFRLEREKLTGESQINASNFNYDNVLKNQVVPLIVQQRMALAEKKGIVVEEEKLTQAITANVFAAWNARKK